MSANVTIVNDHLAICGYGTTVSSERLRPAVFAA